MTMQCPQCGSATFDNTQENAARVARGEKPRPQYKCKSAECGWVQWPPKGGATAPAPRAAPATKQAYSSGPHIPAMDDEHPALPHEKLDKLFALYDLCFAHAHSLAERTMKQDASHEGISAMAATVFIAANDRGIGV